MKDVVNRCLESAVDGVSAAAVAISSDHSTDGCYSDAFICTLCSVGVRALFDQFVVEQSNSLKSVRAGFEGGTWGDGGRVGVFGVRARVCVEGVSARAAITSRLYAVILNKYQ